MRIGTVSLGRIGTDATIYIDTQIPVDPGIIPGDQQSGGYTSGPSASGDTLMCPPGHPYDYVIHDCHGYAGSPDEGMTLSAQADMDACMSYRDNANRAATWDYANARCVYPGQSESSIIPGVPNIALYVVGGFLLLTAMKRR